VLLKIPGAQWKRFAVLLFGHRLWRTVFRKYGLYKDFATTTHFGNAKPENLEKRLNAKR